MWSLPRAGQAISTGAMAIVLGVSVSACSIGPVTCTLEPVEGDLVEQGGRTALSNFRGISRSFFDGPLVWPDGWSLRTVEGGALEVVDPDGVARARTGERIAVRAVSDNGSPMVTLGGLLVCPWDPFRPIDAD